MKKSRMQKRKSPSQLIDERIKELGDWRGTMLSRLRVLIKQADPQVVEEWKWRGVPVWSHEGMICTGERYKIPPASSMPVLRETPGVPSTFTRVTR
ncbi:protein of unknown function [Nitrospira japonica]|uniref:YdhG-like domain-containing protein n=1 Tax=Nitrospira japonica TaxID=1325564 RepID=A0A1W1IAE1_9BACT|nr:protein of unknown function [Nitrospira japonica]